jgi:signal transduction histidine kinase
MGAGVGILLPALLLAYYQITTKLDTEIDLRVRVPMQQYADVLASGVAVAIWNVDRAVAAELVEAVMRNPDVASVTVTDEYKEVFVRRQNLTPARSEILREERFVTYNNSRVGQLSIELTTTRIEKELRDNLMKLVAAIVAQVAISFAFIWLLFDHRIVRPLHELKEGALRLARGNLDQPLQWHRRDEIGSLAGGLDKMRADLGTLLAERDQKNRTLQQELAERLRTEEALNLSRAKFSAIFDASPVAMTVSALGGDFALRDLNASWVNLFGRSREAMLASPDAELAVWKSAQDRSTVMDALARTGEVARQVSWMVGMRASATSCARYRAGSLPMATSLLILAYEDITAKHQYEENILALNASLEQRVALRTQELSSALDHLTTAQTELVRTEKMAALGSLVAGIAHELNTPIGNSLTVASTLQDQTKAFVTEMGRGLTRSRLEEYVGTIQEGAGILMRGLRHAADLVSSFKQVAVDQTSINRRRFDLRETLMKFAHHGAGHSETTILLSARFPTASAWKVTWAIWADTDQLVNNALLHAFEGIEQGLVTISSVRLDADWVAVSVQDNGIGIPDHNLSRVFDPFFTTKLGRGGSGLGLNIVYNLVQDVLGGSITVSNVSANNGACFTLTLPVSAPVQPDPPHPD